MNFEEAGAALRAEREKRNLTIEDVAEELKISPRQLRALENGDLDSLPHPAYAKGFIRSYASWLGLRPEDLRMQKTQNDENENITTLSMSEKSDGSGFKGIWLILLLASLAAGIYYAWQKNFWNLFDSGNNDEIVISRELPTADDYLGQKDRERDKVPGDPPISGGEGNKPLVEEKKEAPVIAPVELPDQKQTSLNLPPKPLSTETTPRAQSQEPVIPASSGSDISIKNESPAENHKLIITAIEECWVHSNSDKTDTRQFSLRKGDTFALTFMDNLELKLGNAGGVRIRYDGKDMPPAGTSGQVKTIFFPPKENNE